MSKNGGSGCDGCPYLVMSQMVSARERGITRLQARLTFHYLSYLSRAAPIQPSIFIFIFQCHLALALKFIYALFLSSVFVHSLYFLIFFFYLPSTSSPLDRVFWWFWFSFLFLSPFFNKAFACPTAVLHMYVTFPRPCCLQLENLWQSKTWALCKQRYRMSSPQLHRYAYSAHSVCWESTTSPLCKLFCITHYSSSLIVWISILWWHHARMPTQCMNIFIFMHSQHGLISNCTAV